MYRSYTYVDKSSTQNEYIKCHGIFKGKKCIDEYANLKYNYGNRHFWSEGYYVSTVGLNKATIKKYIREQETEDMIKNKRNIKEYKDPFKDNKSDKSNW